MPPSSSSGRGKRKMKFVRGSAFLCGGGGDRERLENDEALFEGNVEDDLFAGRDQHFGDRGGMIARAAIGDLVTAEGNAGEGIAARGIGHGREASPCFAPCIRATWSIGELDGDAGKRFLGCLIDDEAADSLGLALGDHCERQQEEQQQAGELFHGYSFQGKLKGGPGPGQLKKSGLLKTWSELPVFGFWMLAIGRTFILCDGVLIRSDSTTGG